MLFEAHAQLRLRVDLHHAAVTECHFTPLAAIGADRLPRERAREPQATHDDAHHAGGDRAHHPPLHMWTGSRILVPSLRAEVGPSDHARLIAFAAGIDLSPTLKALQALVHIGHAQ